MSSLGCSNVILTQHRVSNDGVLAKSRVKSSQWKRVPKRFNTSGSRMLFYSLLARLTFGLVLEDLNVKGAVKRSEVRG